MSLRPIFVGGCERSGTTFLGSLLGAAPGAITVPESLFRLSGTRAIARGERSADAMARMRRHHQFGAWRTTGPPSGEIPPSCALRDLIEGFVGQYVRAKGGEAREVWIDHTPFNTQYALHWADQFPEARFVHLVRDGRGVAASLMPLSWGPNTIEYAARFWIARVAYGLALEHSRLADRTIRVRYEDLLAHPEPTLRRLCDFCGLDFTERMLEGGRFDVPALTTYQHGLVGRPPQPGRAGAWEQELTGRQVEIFEHVAGEMLGMLGYSTRHGITARKPSKEERFVLAVRELTRGELENPFQKWRRRLGVSR